MNAAGWQDKAAERAELAVDRAHALALISVSRETEARLDRLVDVLLDWQGRMNLIAPSTIPHIWTRHIADSLQLLMLAPQARIWADLGSGGGFPGLVIGCALAETAAAHAGVADAHVHLVESSTKKSGFLREAARVIGAPCTIHTERIEDFVKHPPKSIDAVTARALAPLPKLLGLAYPLLKKGIPGLFLKGQDVEAELTEAAKCWNIQATLVRSRTEPRARIVVVQGLEEKR
jgi:16S rRNA (guanine527-N7)-methyltransferase